MKIERPDWQSFKGFELSVLDVWFDQQVEPINDILAKGVEITGPFRFTKHYDHESYEVTEGYKVIVLGPEPIKKQTREEKLEEFIKSLLHDDEHLSWDNKQRAKAVLRESE